MTFHLKKCRQFRIRIDHFGVVICLGCLEVSTQKIDTIRRLQQANYVMELMSFLVLCIAFRHFVPNFALVSTLLNEKLCKAQLQAFQVLTEDEITALVTLKAKLVDHPILALPRLQDGNSMDADLCEEQIGCVHLQKLRDDTDRPI